MDKRNMNGIVVAEGNANTNAVKTEAEGNAVTTAKGGAEGNAAMTYKEIKERIAKEDATIKRLFVRKDEIVSEIDGCRRAIRFWMNELKRLGKREEKSGVGGAFPKKLTVDEWNLLVIWSGYSKLDTWFDLRQSADHKSDYVYDRDNRRELSLHDALVDFTDGIYIDIEDWHVTDRQIRTWNTLMDKFNLPHAKISR